MTGTLFARIVRRMFPGILSGVDKPSRRVLLDNEPCQNCAAAVRAFAAVGAQRLRIPPRSPDLNPIENIFNITKQALARTAVRDHIERETEAQFAERVQRTLRDVAMLHADRTIESMPTRVRLIANGNGHRSRY